MKTIKNIVLLCSALLTTAPAFSQESVIAYFTRAENNSGDPVTDARTMASVLDYKGTQVGTTKFVASIISEYTNAPLFPIKTQETLPGNSDELVDLNHDEQNNNAFIEVNSIDISKYDTIYIGFPVWANSVPRAVISFLNNLDLEGKTVVPFCTHNGFGQGLSYEQISTIAKEAKVLDILSLDAGNVTQSQQIVKQYLENNNLISTDPNSTQKGSADNPILGKITVNGKELNASFNSSELAQNVIAQFPVTVNMYNYGSRELYGPIDGVEQPNFRGQKVFENGDITYCPANRTIAIFYNKAAGPNLNMEVYPIGKMLDDSSDFINLPSNVSINFSIK